VIQGDDCRPRRRSWPRFPLALSCPELLQVTGPLLSLVFRTEDVWQRYNQFIETFRGSQSGFPLLTPTMQAGQDSDGCGSDCEEMCMLHVVIVLWGGGGGGFCETLRNTS